MTNRVMRCAAAVVAALAFLFVSGARPALAADALVIRQVDTTEFPVVRLSAMVTGESVDPGEFAVREGGRIVNTVEVVPIGQTATAVGIVLVIDTSGSMKGTKIEAAKAAARGFVERKQPNERIAVVAFSDTPRVVLNFTDDQSLITGAIDGLVASGETALWDGVRVGAGLFADQTGVLANMVVLSDGADTVSRYDATTAIGAATAEQVAVFAVGLQGSGEFDRASLESLAAATNGLYVQTTDARQLTQLYAGIQQQIQNQYEITYTSESTAASIDITVVAGGIAAELPGVPTGTFVEGESTSPALVEPPAIPAVFSSDLALPVVAALIVLAAGAAVLALVALLQRDRSSLDDALAPYFGIGGGRDNTVAETADRPLAQTAVVRRAVEATARLANQRGVLDMLERRLDQADLRLRPQEALFFFVAFVAVISLGMLIFLGPLAGVGTLAVVGLAPVAILNVLADQRQRAFSAQLPDTLQLLASALRAGYSMQQAIDTVANEVSGPMGRELRRVVVESALARPLEDALAESAARMGSPDFDWAVIAIKIQREVGGNLAELLTTVADTMVARERMRREVRALTAEGRFSAMILLLLPIILGAIIFVLNPGYMVPLFNSTLGQIMLVGSFVLAGAGFLWMRKIIEIKV